MLSRTEKEKRLRARVVANLTEANLRLLFSIPRRDERISLVARWLRFKTKVPEPATAAASASPLPPAPEVAEPPATAPTAPGGRLLSPTRRGDAHENTLAVAPAGSVAKSTSGLAQAVSEVGLNVGAVPDTMIAAAVERAERAMIVASLAYGLIEMCFAADFDAPAIHAAVLVLLETHSHVRRDPTPDLAVDLAHFRSHLFAAMVPQPPTYTPALSRAQGKRVHTHLLSTLFRHYHLHKHVYVRPPPAAPHVAGPPNSAMTSTLALAATPAAAATDAAGAVPDPFASREKVVAAMASSSRSVGSRPSSSRSAIHAHALPVAAAVLPDDPAELDRVQSQLAKLRVDWNSKLDALEGEIRARKAAKSTAGVS
ncbi:hypothetical protein H9P43_000689 [Blastocladiella emersonii ATCC 22665]|nr:hypothetical protein H9P43_000689 [Blastocladiella emersonii ATCC 22665]